MQTMQMPVDAWSAGEVALQAKPLGFAAADDW
jgi:hypothetical protein